MRNARPPATASEGGEPERGTIETLAPLNLTTMPLEWRYIRLNPRFDRDDTLKLLKV